MPITTKISCGLGNQMFQYAFGRFLAIKNSTDLILDITDYKTDTLRKYELHRFQIREHFANESDIPLYKIRKINTIQNKTLRYFFNIILNLLIYKVLVYCVPGYVQEKNLAFNKKYLESKDNSYLSGFWQSYKYFESIRDLLMKEFQPKETLDERNQQIVNQMKSTNSVCIHFRRGDYVTQKSFFKPNLTPCKLEYYQKATHYIEKTISNPTYYIFSDDPERVKQNFKTSNNCVYIDWNKGDEAYKDLILMTHGKNIIIANSTFSRWGAWLNNNADKIVVCPKKWFNKDALHKQAKYLYPKEWITI